MIWLMLPLNDKLEPSGRKRLKLPVENIISAKVQSRHIIIFD